MPPLSRKKTPPPTPASTFLEYVCRKLLGPPSYSRGDGEAHWPCPRCYDDSWHTRPTHPHYADKFSCYRCTWWGDEHDLLRHFHPGWDYPTRQANLARWRQEYETMTDRPDNTHNNRVGNTNTTGSLSSSPRGSGIQESESTWERDDFAPEADAAQKDLLTALTNLPNSLTLRDKWQLCSTVLDICAHHGIHPLGLAKRCRAEEWFLKIEEEHMAECTDTDCDWWCCRISQGWTPEEIRADIESYKQEIGSYQNAVAAIKAKRKRQEQERIDQVIRKLIRVSGRRPL